jgi:hypothetical protein
MKTLWHRFPKKDFAAVKRALDALGQSGPEIMADADLLLLHQNLDAAQRGFAEKSDLKLDVHLLIMQLELSLLICPDVPTAQLRDVLSRIRRYHRGMTS